jgi:hypothetical protein
MLRKIFEELKKHSPFKVFRTITKVAAKCESERSSE